MQTYQLSWYNGDYWEVIVLGNFRAIQEWVRKKWPGGMWPRDCKLFVEYFETFSPRWKIDTL